MNTSSTPLECLRGMRRLLTPYLEQPADPQALVAAWTQQSQSSIQAARDELDQHWSMRLNGRITWVACALGALTGLALAVADSAPSQSYGSLAFVLTVCGLFGAMAFVLAWQGALLPLFQRSRPTLRHLLEPASREPFLCRSVVDHVETESTVRQYRDAAVRAGRELTVMDLQFMLDLAYREKAAKEAEARRQTCLQLHGLAS